MTKCLATRIMTDILPRGHLFALAKCLPNAYHSVILSFSLSVLHGG